MDHQLDIRHEPRYTSIPAIRRMRQRSNFTGTNTEQSSYPPPFQNNILPIDQYRAPERDDASSFFTEKSSPGAGEAQTYINGFPHQRSALKQPFRGPYIVRGEGASNEGIHNDASKNMYRRLLWPTFVICVPMLGLAGVLIGLIFRYIVRPVPNIFDTASQLEMRADHTHLLVHFSATDLVFLASFLSTTAPILIGCIMSLMAVLAYRELAKASNTSSFPTLPTPYQMSLLIGLLSASYQQLYNSFMHLWSRNRQARTSPVLLYAMTVFLLSVFLGIAVTLTDAYLHIATQTVSMVLYNTAPSPSAQLGRGLNSYCLGFDRNQDNYGYPCTYADTVELAMNQSFQNGQFEIQRLLHNTSTLAQIQLANVSNADVHTVAYVLPTLSDRPFQTNYHAKTMGVGSSCKLIPPSACNISYQGSLTSFNCSSQFWGTLGAPALAASFAGARPETNNLSFLAVNPASTLIYNYFADEDLETVYNTAGLNSTAQMPADWQPWPDSELQTTVYAAYAWRSGVTAFPGWGTNGMFQSDLVSLKNGTSYIDYFVKCAVSAYEIDYVWTNDALHSITATKYDNGSVLNMWTGLIPYTPYSGNGGTRLPDYSTQSVIAGNSTETYLQTFEGLISTDALSAIAAYTSPRTVLEEQSYYTALLARVPKLALGLLLACSLLYPVIGIVLVICAGRAIRKSGPITPLFSYWGLTWAAFVQSGGQDEYSTLDLQSKYSRDDEDNIRLYVHSRAGQGDKFGLLKRGPSGEVVQVTKSQTEVGGTV